MTASSRTPRDTPWTAEELEACKRAGFFSKDTPITLSKQTHGWLNGYRARFVPSAERRVLTDDRIINAAITAADALDATRVSEMRPGGWHATTIFDGDTGLIRFGRLIEEEIRRKEG